MLTSRESAPNAVGHMTKQVRHSEPIKWVIIELP